MAWGGKRSGAGRPKKDKSEVTPSRSIRANKEQWKVIKPFVMLVKMGYQYECWNMLFDFIKDLDEKNPPDSEQSYMEWYWEIEREIDDKEM